MPKRAGAKTKKVTISPRMQAIMDGKMSIEDLDDEEIERGQIRDKNGGFRGTKMDMIPRKFYEQARAEMLRRWQMQVEAELAPALKVLRTIAHNERLPADARYKSAVYLIERAAGKVPEKTEMKVEVAKWEEDIEGLFYEDDDKPKKKKGSEA